MNIAVKVKELIPVRPDTFFGSIHTTLVDMTYHKLSKLAHKARLQRRFVTLTKTIDFENMQMNLLKLKNEFPKRMTMYDLDIYSTEIFSITFGNIGYNESAKKIIEEITEHASTEDLIELNIKKWDLVRERLNTFIYESTKLLLEEDYTKEQAYHIVTYLQGLIILKKIVHKYESILLKKKWKQSSDFSEALELIAKFLFLSLITAKYIDGGLSPKEYMYNMEYISEIFVMEKEESSESEDIESLMILKVE